MRHIHRVLAVACAVGAVLLGTCYAGGMERVGAPRGEIGALIFAIVLVVLAVFFWRRRHRRME